jgi:hypothetical protein
MSDWVCQICANTVRARTRAPSYCQKCGLGIFSALEDPSTSPSRGDIPVPPNPSVPRSSPSAQVAEVPPQAPTAAPPTPEPPRGCRSARRIRPKEPLEVRFARTVPLEALDISTTGLLVEHARPFAPGSICEVELWRSSLGIRLRAEVVRSFVSGGGKGSHTGIRYRTAVHFLETPQTIFMLLPELSEPH